MREFRFHSREGDRVLSAGVRFGVDDGRDVLERTTPIRVRPATDGERGITTEPVTPPGECGVPLVERPSKCGCLDAPIETFLGGRYIGVPAIKRLRVRRSFPFVRLAEFPGCGCPLRAKAVWEAIVASVKHLRAAWNVGKPEPVPEEVQAAPPVESPPRPAPPHDRPPRESVATEVRGSRALRRNGRDTAPRRRPCGG